jgi:hypothetical protein
LVVVGWLRGLVAIYTSLIININWVQWTMLSIITALLNAPFLPDRSPP